MASKIERETVIGLLRSLPDDGLLSIGMGIKPISRDEVIAHVEKEDDIGCEIVSIYMNYLRSFKELAK